MCAVTSVAYAHLIGAVHDCERGSPARGRAGTVGTCSTWGLHRYEVLPNASSGEVRAGCSAVRESIYDLPDFGVKRWRAYQDGDVPLCLWLT